jgi:S-adenosylmethionine hydrolase
LKVITITTDFGNSDGFVGVMKGVMLGIENDLKFVDLCNDIAPGDIASGAWTLANSYHFFPKGTIHLAIVDPGVGSSRRGLVVRSAGHLFVAPDNGLLTGVLQEVGAVDCYRINQPQYWRSEVSATFHGRDIFAPVAAHLASGVDAAAVGEEIDFESLVRLPSAPMEIGSDTVRGAVVHIDRFGNLITNIPATALESARHCVIHEKQVPVGETYSSVPPGHALALPGSHGFVEIGVNSGRAHASLDARVGTKVLLKLDA